jgi:hypothetical protein
MAIVQLRFRELEVGDQVVGNEVGCHWGRAAQALLVKAGWPCAILLPSAHLS